jgi:crotonobetainyl-CoA:carnitine CoA-transferase CaiB-like acyl-CoA transferase
VIDATWGMPGSVASLLLADNGASVIKIERPDAGVSSESLLRLAWERGKKSIELDVRNAADREVLIGLLRGADVFCESFGPGRAQALGLDFESLQARFPRLICCSITGYGHSGPWRDEPGYDCLVAAKLGLMVEQASAGREGPIFLGHPHIGYGTGFLAAIGILAAVRARHSTQRGQLVDVSLLDGVLAQSPMNWWWHPENLSYVQVQDGKRVGFGRKRLITAAFECADGEFIQVHTGGQGGFKRMMEIFGFGDMTQTITGGAEMSVPLNDEELVIARDYIPDAFKLRPRQEWLDLFHANDLAALPVLRPGEVLKDEQVTYAKRVLTVDHPTLGAIRQAAPPLTFSASPLATPEPAPAVGEHNHEIRRLAASGVSRTPAAETPPKQLQHALQGIRILDFSSFFATAYGAKLLSDLGADVITIEPPGGDQMRPLPNPFEACQRGKRNIVIDLKSAEGREIVYDLVRTADVIVHNQRPGKAEKLRIDYKSLSALNPQLVYCYLPGYGSSGPKSHLKAFAPLISGFTGLLYEGAGEGNAPVRSVEGNEDYYNGLLGAVAVLLGLQHRAVSGKGQYIESPQLHSSLFVTSHHFLGPSDESLTALQLDHEQMGWGPLYRLYRTADDWLCIACVGDAAFGRLGQALSLPSDLIARCSTDGRRREHATELAAALMERFAQLTSAAARDLLKSNRVACEIPSKEPGVPKLFWEEWAARSGQIVEQPDSMHGPIREIGLCMRLSTTPGQHKGPAPRLGQHTDELLRELGYDAERIQRCVAAGAVFRHDPADPT